LKKKKETVMKKKNWQADWYHSYKGIVRVFPGGSNEERGQVFGYTWGGQNDGGK